MGTEKGSTARERAAARSHPLRNGSTRGLTRRINPDVDDAEAWRAHALVMSTLDYILGLSALALILLNMRGHELTDRRLRRPVVIAAVVCVVFLRAVPTTGSDGALIAVGLLAGVASGTVSALATRVERDAADGRVVATGTPLAVGVTAVAFAGRMAFAFAATHGLGPGIARFSSRVGIDSAQAWVAALILMATADLLVRALILWRRRQAIAAGTDWTVGLHAA